MSNLYNTNFVENMGQRFEEALITGDMATCESVLSSLRQYGFDTEANTLEESLGSICV